MGGLDSDFACVASGISGAKDAGVVEGDVAWALNCHVSGNLVAFGVTFDADVVEVDVAWAEDRYVS